MTYHLRHHAPKLWLHRRPRLIFPYDHLTIACWLVVVALLVRWL